MEEKVSYWGSPIAVNVRRQANSFSELMCRIKSLEIRHQHPAPPQTVKSQWDFQLVSEFSGTWLSHHSHFNTTQYWKGNTGSLGAQSPEMVRPSDPNTARSHPALHPWASYQLSSKIGTITSNLMQQHENACDMYMQVTDTGPMPCTVIWMLVTGICCPGCCVHGHTDVFELVSSNPPSSGAGLTSRTGGTPSPAGLIGSSALGSFPSTPSLLHLAGFALHVLGILALTSSVSPHTLIYLLYLPSSIFPTLLPFPLKSDSFFFF